MKDDWTFYLFTDYDFTAFFPGARVLDIGCGRGNLLRKLLERGCRPVGVEPAQDRLESCGKLGLRVLAGYAEQLPFPAATFDGVICKAVIPYTAESLALREIARVIKAEGIAQMCYVGAGFYLRYLILGGTPRATEQKHQRIRRVFESDEPLQ
ncbi:MAG TPA: class I SAM-dependent methyltransferase [Terriglobales bacterium]|nr:class I SAM-dependent methyltransferase [Terriglobales bacterium]